MWKEMTKQGRKLGNMTQGGVEEGTHIVRKAGKEEVGKESRMKKGHNDISR